MTFAKLKVKSLADRARQSLEVTTDTGARLICRDFWLPKDHRDKMLLALVLGHESYWLVTQAGGKERNCENTTEPIAGTAKISVRFTDLAYLYAATFKLEGHDLSVHHFEIRDERREQLNKPGSKPPDIELVLYIDPRSYEIELSTVRNQPDEPSRS
jgi:hypothetical protein